MLKCFGDIEIITEIPGKGSCTNDVTKFFYFFHTPVPLCPFLSQLGDPSLLRDITNMSRTP